MFCRVIPIFCLLRMHTHPISYPISTPSILSERLGRGQRIHQQRQKLSKTWDKSRQQSARNGRKTHCARTVRQGVEGTRASASTARRQTPPNTRSGPKHLTHLIIILISPSALFPETMGQPDPNQPHPMTSNMPKPHVPADNGFDDPPPPSYEASTAAVSTSGAPPAGQQSPRSSVSSTRSHHGLLPVSSPPAPQAQPTANSTASPGPENTQGYAKTDPMAWVDRTWDDNHGKPGCCGSSSGGCCFSSRGGCCFSDRGGCCFSDREGCCFSDRGGCCWGDLEGAWCSSRGACCFSQGPTQ